MPPTQIETRRGTLVAAVAAEQRLPIEAIARQLERYPPSVIEFFIVSHEHDGARGFQDAFRLIDLAQNLGGQDLAVPNAEMLDPVVLAGRIAEGGPFQLSVPRSALNLDRADLLRLLKQRLGVDRPTRQTAFVRPTPRPMKRPVAVSPAGAAPTAPQPPAPAHDIGLAGRLHQMPIEDLVQIFQLQRKSGVLHVHDVSDRERELGTIGFEGGQIAAAAAAGTTGEAAFFLLATLPDGLFRMVDASPGARNITRQTASLLMEAARLKDEGARG